MRSETHSRRPVSEPLTAVAGAEEDQASPTAPRAPRSLPEITWQASPSGREPLVDFWVGNSRRAATPSTLARLPLAAPLLEGLTRGEPGRLTCDVALFDWAIRLARQGGRLPGGPLPEAQALEAAARAAGCDELARELRLQPYRQACEGEAPAVPLCGLAMALSAEGCDAEAEDVMARARERLVAGLDVTMSHCDVGLSCGASERAAAAHLEARWALQSHANAVCAGTEDRWEVTKVLAPLGLNFAALSAYTGLCHRLHEIPAAVLLLIAEVAWESNANDRALSMLDEAAKQVPRDPYTLAFLGEVLCQLQRLSESAAATAQAMSVAVTARGCATAARLAASGQPVDGRDGSPAASWQTWVARGRALAADDARVLFELADVAKDQGCSDRQALFAAARLPSARWYHRLVGAGTLLAYGRRQHATDRAEAEGWLRRDLADSAPKAARRSKILDALANLLAHEGRVQEAVDTMHEGGRNSLGLVSTPGRVFLRAAALRSEHEQWALALVQSACALPDATCCPEALVLGLQAALRLKDHEALWVLGTRAQSSRQALLNSASDTTARETELSQELDIWRAQAEVRLAAAERARIPALADKFTPDQSGEIGRLFLVLLRFLFLHQAPASSEHFFERFLDTLFAPASSSLGAQAPVSVHLIECMARCGDFDRVAIVVEQLTGKDPQATVGHCGRPLSAFLVAAAERLKHLDRPQMVATLVNRALQDTRLPKPTRLRAASLIEALGDLPRAEILRANF